MLVLHLDHCLRIICLRKFTNFCESNNNYILITIIIHDIIPNLYFNSLKPKSLTIVETGHGAIDNVSSYMNNDENITCANG